MIILVDQDNTIADMETAFFEEWQKQFPDLPYINIDERRHHDFFSDYPKELGKRVWEVLHSEGFFRNLPVISGAVEALHAMIEMGHDVRICTSPLSNFEHCVLEKYHWVDEHLGRNFADRMILTKDKTLIYGDVLIDDKPEILGIHTPAWKHIFYEAPYNKHLKNGTHLNWGNWKNVLGELSSTKKQKTL